MEGLCTCECVCVRGCVGGMMMEKDESERESVTVTVYIGVGVGVGSLMYPCVLSTMRAGMRERS